MADNKAVPVFEKPDLSGLQDREEGRLSRKIKESPFMVAGLSGCTLACIYGAYRFKRRGHLSISNYLMQLRVAAQGTVITCLTLGVVYSLFQRFTKKEE